MSYKLIISKDAWKSTKEEDGRKEERNNPLENVV
jgi:hypothetical protein